MPGNETAAHAIHIHNSQLASSLSSSTVCGVVLESGCEYYGSSVDAAGGLGSVEKNKLSLATAAALVIYM